MYDTITSSATTIQRIRGYTGRQMPQSTYDTLHSSACQNLEVASEIGKRKTGPLVFASDGKKAEAPRKPDARRLMTKGRCRAK